MSSNTTTDTKYNSRTIPDPLVYSQFTGFQRDLLRTIAALEDEHCEPHGDTYGLAIKRSLEDDYGEAINHGRLYPNLDTLVDMGLIEKGSADDRTNTYTLTSEGRAMLEEALARFADQLGYQPPEPRGKDDE